MYEMKSSELTAYGSIDGSLMDGVYVIKLAWDGGHLKIPLGMARGLAETLKHVIARHEAFIEGEELE